MTANPLYQQWTLAGVLFATTIACLSALWYVYHLKADQTRTAVLEIRSALSRLFQEIVAEESLRIFDYVESNLPSALSQVDVTRPSVSAFDRLCIELRKVEPANPDRVLFKGILEQLLAGLIAKEARRLVHQSSENAKRLPNGDQIVVNQGEGPVGFSYQTEVRLAFLAKKTTQANNHETLYGIARKWCFRLMAIEPICAIGLLISVLFADWWSYVFGFAFILAWSCALLLYILSFVVQIRSYNWLLDSSRKDCLKNEWQAELTKVEM